MSQLREEQQMSFDPFTQTQFSGIENFVSPKAEVKKRDMNTSAAISQNDVSQSGTRWTPKLKQSNQFNMVDLL